MMPTDAPQYTRTVNSIYARDNSSKTDINAIARESAFAYRREANDSVGCR